MPPDAFKQRELQRLSLVLDAMQRCLAAATCLQNTLITLLLSVFDVRGASAISTRSPANPLTLSQVCFNWLYNQLHIKPILSDMVIVDLHMLNALKLLRLAMRARKHH